MCAGKLDARVCGRALMAALHDMGEHPTRSPLWARLAARSACPPHGFEEMGEGAQGSHRWGDGLPVRAMAETLLADGDDIQSTRVRGRGREPRLETRGSFHGWSRGGGQSPRDV